MAAGFGAYGKIPSLGDFLRLGIAPGFARPWDGWLQAAMTEARGLLGERWTGCYCRRRSGASPCRAAWRDRRR